MSDQRNLLLAIVLSLAILLGFQFVYELPGLKDEQPHPQTTEQPQGQAPAPPGATAPAPGQPPVTAAAPMVPGVTPRPAATIDQARATALGESPRIAISTQRLSGSLALRGARFDDLTLATYRETLEKDSPNIVLLSPGGTASRYYADFGWSGGPGSEIKRPGPDTLWRSGSSVLGIEQPVTLTWDNGQGLKFIRRVALDENYMFTVTQRVENRGTTPVTLHPYGLLSRTDTPSVSVFWILHEGAIGVFNGTLFETGYDDVRDDGRIEKASTGGWIGITDKYWLTALVPDRNAPFSGSFNHRLTDAGRDLYQADYIRGGEVVPAGGAVEVVNRLFVGAKEVKILDAYMDENGLGIANFDKAVDFGWFYFITKPLFYVLRYFSDLLGNFALAILLLTVIVKLIFFPLANKSYRAMSAMKKLQPEITRIRDRYKEDRQRMNREMMDLYKRAKTNPAAGCLPIVVQIPVFFALYKVLFVTIEMRHAPAFGWIQDLSARDPTSIFNLFGLVPWDPPSFLLIGIWPLIMGASMYLQQRLNPQPADPVQAKIFMLLPVVFTVVLAPFPAGLVIYWTWNNLLSITQQWVIMKREGIANPAAT